MAIVFIAIYKYIKLTCVHLKFAWCYMSNIFQLKNTFTCNPEIRGSYLGKHLSSLIMNGAFTFYLSGFTLWSQE